MNTKEAAPLASISITPAAALKSWEFIQEENNPDLKVRIAIKGGACHGFKYDFSLSDQVDPEDTVITQVVPTASSKIATVQWVIDCISLQILNGVEIDYESNLAEESFILRHLKVKSQCSCGQSFSLPDEEEAVS